jgi:hypothetical protein
MKIYPMKKNKQENLFKKGVGSMQKDKNEIKANDSLYEGRDKMFMDIDRMINEGLSGGSVHYREDVTNIEEAHNFTEEFPPNKVD